MCLKLNSVVNIRKYIGLKSGSNNNSLLKCPKNCSKYQLKLNFYIKNYITWTIR